MRRTDRLFDLIQLLRDGRLHRAADLAGHLGVSVRTIWRDMATLSASGLPVEGEWRTDTAERPSVPPTVVAGSAPPTAFEPPPQARYPLFADEVGKN
mgnify:CR=1 FL=1